MKKFISLALSAALALSLLAGCAPKQAETTAPTTAAPTTAAPTAAPTTEAPETAPVPFENPLNFVVLAGPTGVGAAKMMADSEAAGDQSPYNITVEADNQIVTTLLTSGDVDIAAIATNVASTLYNKMEGSIQMLAVNTLGVLYILEKGDSVSNMSDLRGKTIWTTGQGANPEYTLNHLLALAGLTVGEDVNVEFMTAPEVSAKMMESDDGICMLPVPASTALMIQDHDIREAVNLNSAWQELTDTQLTMGCVAVRTDYLNEHPDQVAQFMTDYSASIDYISNPSNLADASQMVANYKITPNAKVAELAIPKCSLDFMTGAAMRDNIQSYFQILFSANPKSIGGFIPYDDFFYAG